MPLSPRSGTGTPSLICVAYLIPEKGVDVLLRAMALLRSRDWTLDVVGDGPEAGRLRALAAEGGIADRVRFLGRRDDVPVLLRSADIAVHPATWAEACAYVVLEALEAGCAMVATATGGTPELIRDGETGLLVTPGNADALSAGVARLLADAPLRRRLGEAAHADCVTRFSLAGSAGGYHALAESLFPS